MKENPFTFGSFSREESIFCGRTELMTLAESVLCGQLGPGHLALWGPKKIGKTAMLQRIQALVERRVPNCVSVWWSGGEGMRRDEPDSFLVELRSRLRQALAELTELRPDSASASADVQRMLQAASKGGLRLLLVMDNFHEFAEVWGLRSEQFNFIRSWVQNPQTGDAVSFLASSRVPLHELAEVVGSGLDNVFGSHHHRLGYLSAPEVRELVCRPLERAEISVPGRWPVELFRLCGGHPYLTRRAAWELTRAHMAGEHLDDDGLAEKLQDDFERLSQSVPDSLAPRVSEIVRRAYPPIGTELTEAAEALLRAGLCRRVEEGVAPAGALAARFLLRRYTDYGLDSDPAPPEECRLFAELCSRVERNLRTFVGRQAHDELGPDWTVKLKLPEDLRAQARAGTLTFGGLKAVQLALSQNNRLLPSPEFRAAIDPAITLRNKMLHGQILLATRGELATAMKGIMVLRCALERNAIF